MIGSITPFRAKVLKSVKLSGLRFVSEVGLRMVSTVVLSRLLAPEVYGVFAVVMVYIYLLEMFSDLGIRTLILTKEGEVEPVFLRTCWTVSILRGVVVAALSAAVGLVIWLLQGTAGFAPDSPYADPALPLALTALGFVMFMVGFQTPMRFVRERELELNRVIALDIAANVFFVVAAIILAFYLGSIWALVLGQVLRTLVFVPLTFFVIPGPRMGWCLDRTNLSVVINRGKWIMGSSILTALSQSADRLMLGLVMTSTTFGFYFIARQLADIVMQFLVTLNGQMGVQVFTHIAKSTTVDFRRNYYRYRLVFDALAGLSAGGLLVLAPTVVDVIFDDRYADVAPIAQILVLGVLMTGPLLLGSAYFAERNFRLATLMTVLSMFTLWVGLSVTVLWLGSVTAGLFVISFYRLPEAMVLTYMGWKRGWVIAWREFAGIGFAALGALGGEIILTVWTLF